MSTDYPSYLLSHLAFYLCYRFTTSSSEGRYILKIGLENVTAHTPLIRGRRLYRSPRFSAHPGHYLSNVERSSTDAECRSE